MSTSCHEFVDRIQHPDPDPALAAHLAACPACAAARRAALAIRQQKTLLDPPPDALLQNILRTLPAAPLPPESTTAADSGDLYKRLLASLRALDPRAPALAVGMAVALVAIVAGSILYQSSRSVHPGGRVLLWSGLPAAEAGRIRVTDLSREAVTTTGAVARFLAPSMVREHPEGLFVEEGRVRFTVLPAAAPFAVFTPHRAVHVRGTRFLVDVGSAATQVTVEEGRVETIAPDGTRRLLEAGASDPQPPIALPERVSSHSITVPGVESPPEEWNR